MFTACIQDWSRNESLIKIVQDKLEYRSSEAHLWIYAINSVFPAELGVLYNDCA